MIQVSMRRLAIAAMASVCALCTQSPALAIAVSPMTQELLTTGTGSTARIEVLNNQPQSLPFEVKVTRIEFDSDGAVKETPADADFLVFPPQALVPTNQRQVVRAQWLGGELQASRAYYISIIQLPVQVDRNNTDPTKRSVDVEIIYHMKVLTIVSPRGAAPKVSVESARPTTIIPRPKLGEPAPADTTPQPGVAVTVRNSGKRHAIMTGANWTIEGKGLDGKPLTVVLTGTQLTQIIGVGYLPAIDGRRTFEVPTGKAFSNAPISVKFSN